MTKARLNEKIIQCLCREYQTVWLIDANDLTMKTYHSNATLAIKDSIEMAKIMNSYENSRLWYIKNCVVESDVERMLVQTSMENIIDNTVDGKTYTVEYSRINDGLINYNQLCYSSIFDEDDSQEYILLGFRDIDVRRNAEFDEMTGLLNRHTFFEKAEHLLETYPDIQFDIMISDIVDFKEINETYGTHVGDTIIQSLGSFLAPKMSDKVLLGRFGGDQCVIIAPHQEMRYLVSDEASKEYLLYKEKHSDLPDYVVKFGVLEGVRKEKSILAACDKAHVALNSIKHHYGRQLAYFNDSLKKEFDTNRKIEKNMYKALEKGEFKVFYQPKHDSVTGALVGAEALVRWDSAKNGFMSPADFIPLFEKNGFITEVDDFVWKRTCENIRKWQDEGIATVPISVNTSKLTFEQSDLIEKMQFHAKSNGVLPEQLHIEITETLMEEDSAELIKKLNKIRELGYQVELDDFGSGYSSMNVLGSLPIDIVKLDMSFMQQFGDIKRAKILFACISLAKDLGYKTVSEGVEVEEQCSLLSELGVDYIQGYYYSKPLCEEEFEKYMKNQLSIA